MRSVSIRNSGHDVTFWDNHGHGHLAHPTEAQRWRLVSALQVVMDSGRGRIYLAPEGGYTILVYPTINMKGERR